MSLSFAGWKPPLHAAEIFNFESNTCNLFSSVQPPSAGSNNSATVSPAADHINPFAAVRSFTAVRVATAAVSAVIVWMLNFVMLNL